MTYVPESERNAKFLKNNDMPTKRNMKILVTGAGGYIGTTLTEMLSRDSYEITAIDRFLFGDTLDDIHNVNKIKADIRNLDTIKVILSNKLRNFLDA